MRKKKHQKKKTKNKNKQNNMEGLACRNFDIKLKIQSNGLIVKMLNMTHLKNYIELS
jgi:hypothetical protein